MNSSLAPPPHIGVFDSGVGGLSILRCLRRTWPQWRVTYLADNLYLPYGDKSPEWLFARCSEVTEQLLAQGASLVLVACNTATTQAIAALRQRWPEVAFVGVEPGIKPAVQASRNRRIAVMATAATLRSQRLRALVGQHGADAMVHLHPCPGLADAIEQADDAAIEALIDEACASLAALAVDTVVLGCTHYPLVADHIGARMGGGVTLIETAEAVCRRIASLLPRDQACASAGALAVHSTGDEAAIARAVQRWIHEPVLVTRCVVDAVGARSGVRTRMPSFEGGGF